MGHQVGEIVASSAHKARWSSAAYQGSPFLPGCKLKKASSDKSAPLCSARSSGNGLLQMLAHEFPGPGDLDVVIAGVADENRVVELLVRNGQLQVAAASAEHIPAVSGQRGKKRGWQCCLVCGDLAHREELA